MKTLIQWTLFIAVVALGGYRAMAYTSLEQHPAGEYDEQMWTGASTAAYYMFFKGYHRTAVVPERSFINYAEKYNIAIDKMPPEELQWFDDALWTFGWKAPNAGKFIMGFSVVNFSDGMPDPEGSFYRCSSDASKNKWPGNYSDPQLVRQARIPNALLSTLTIALTAAIGWAFLHYAVGLIAGAYLAGNIFFIQVNSSAGLDSPSIFFTTLSVMMIIVVTRQFFRTPSLWKQLFNAAACGLCIGLAIGSKLNAGVLVYMLALSLALTSGCIILQAMARQQSGGTHEQKEKEERHFSLTNRLCRLLVSAAAAGLLIMGTFIWLNPQVKTSPLLKIKIIREAVDDFFTWRAGVKTREEIIKAQGKPEWDWRKVKSSWPEAFKLVLQRNFYVSNAHANYYGTFGHLAKLKGNILDGFFSFLGMLYLAALALTELFKKKRAGASAVLLMSFIVVLCGNTSFIWIDWTRYHMPIYPLYALMIGSGIYGMAMCLRRCLGPGFHFRNSGPSPPPFC
ncbi:MAG: phospholipid carrier-dependent glycosyltransferase [Pseudomonadota bacterium]